MSDETFRWVIAGGVFLAALCMLLQAVVVVLVYSIFKKFEARATGVIERTEPIIDSVRKIVDDVKPKIASIGADAVDIAKIGKKQAERISEIVQDVGERTKVQVARIDGKVDETVDQVQSAVVGARDVFMKPVREVDGLFSGVRAAMSVYLRPRKSSVDNATQDEEMFI